MGRERRRVLGRVFLAGFDDENYLGWGGICENGFDAFI